MKSQVTPVLLMLFVCACGGTPTGPDGPDPPPVDVTVTFVGAGDIGWCGLEGAALTATLLDGIPGTVFTTGDNAYFQGSSQNFSQCYDPFWGRHKGRTRPTPGNHDYETPGAAGYFGYRFWDDLLSVGHAGSFVAWDASGGRFTQRRIFTFAAYVNGAWDESVNCSVFHPELAREVATALASRSLTCPAGGDLTLAELPDADLYVNPIHLAELLTSKFELRSFSHTLGSDAAGTRVRTGYLWRRHARP